MQKDNSLLAKNDRGAQHNNADRYRRNPAHRMYKPITFNRRTCIDQKTPQKDLPDHPNDSHDDGHLKHPCCLFSDPFEVVGNGFRVAKF